MMKIMSIKRTLMTVGVIVFVFSVSGCLVVTSNSSYEKGVKVTPATLQRIEVGQTTEQWVIATLGEPSERNVVEGQPNVEIFKYQHTTHESSGGTVLFLFAGHESNANKSVVYIEITDGVVSDYWTEQ